ncbi:quinone oxidoreductase, NADPH-dependent [Thiomonas sp. X19]|uniref:quinone oxidoreductase family protein n=1 Tax=Thiomonas sp. X19 TaxID=1050370 RepID=UPI000B732045|nr:quinone oxidoreductase [Thiomonas sp. X19]SCC95322.1 quinone oxidoreductase, NADPH-dependent [Thiomonas sp. X19]
MTTTHAIRIDRTGGPEVLQWQELPLGNPGPGEVRVRHGAVGVNFIDIYHRTGLYPLQFPAGLGLEAAGTVEAVGEGVTSFAPGDRVAYCNGPTGAYAQARVMPARVLVKLPDAIAFDIAAAMMLKGLTAQFLLRRTRKLQAGDVALFHAAAGGVGLIAGQWARALGVQLIGTAGSDEKCRLALQNGYAHCINYRSEDLVSRVKELTGGKGVAVVYDSVGRDTWERSLACLQPFGLMVSFGNASGPVPPVTLTDLAAKGSLYVTRPTLMTHIADRDTLEQMAAELFAVVGSGQVKPLIGQRFALRDAAQAHIALESRATTGSIVLEP